MSTAGLKEVLGERKRTRMVQFLMKLHLEFESIRGSLLNREVTPAITPTALPGAISSELSASSESDNRDDRGQGA
ncbi:hypothetical protein KY284_030417 [Solanum tuberosum]|nr:hypothetical protein KY284_030417 [Solanum tuberosum]